MFTIHTIKSTEYPEKFIYLNNGYWYYNYNITKITMEEVTPEEEISFKDGYEYSYVRIKGKPTYPKCFEAILKEYKNEENTSLFDYYSLNIENELISSIEYKVKVDFGLEEEDTPLSKQKRKLMNEIDAYDASDEVNSFFLNGIKVWLNKNTRVGLMNSLTIEKNSGKEESTLWFNNICITINCDAAIQMLSALELYALSCYNVTAQHRVAVQNLTTLDAAMDYDYTAGYPEKLSFTI